VTVATSIRRLEPALRREIARPRVRASARLAAITLCLGIFSLAGMGIALRAFSAASYQVGPARMSISTSFAGHGSVDVYVPIVDWGVRAEPYTAPIRMSATLVSVDRRAALRTLQTPDDARTHLSAVEDQAPIAVRAALRRAALLLLLGGLAGGLVGGLVLDAILHRRRVLLLGLAAGFTAAACTIAVCALTLRSPNYGVFRQPTFYAHGGDLPRLLEFSQRLTNAGDSYQSSYQQALSGLDTLVTAAAGDRLPVVQRSFMVASDIHANWLTLPAFARYADHRPVFLVGDFALEGTPIEASIAHRAAQVGHPTVAVSGNHDSPIVMRRLAQAGAIVLTHAGRMAGDGAVSGPAVVTVDGLQVAGYEDPLGAQAGDFGHRLDLTPAELDADTAAVEAWFDALPTRPDIVLVHDFRVAARLRIHVASEGGARVMILTGHDHRQHVDQSGDVVEVDGGTLGAGGVFDVGHASAGFAQVYLTADGWPAAVDLISADPISGDATARRIALDPPSS
jgi:Calcineurin-like phosphoesterase superfamily domain